MSLRVALDARALDLGYLREQGIGRYTASLVRALGPVASERRGELVVMRAGAQAGSVFSDGRAGTAPETMLVRRPPLPERLAVMCEQLLLAPDVRRARASVLHALSPFRASLWPGVPWVVTVHDVIPLLFAREYLRSGLFYRLLFAASRRATVILTDSECSKADIAAELGVPRDVIEVVPCAADEVFRPLRSPETLSRLGVRRPYVLYVGGLSESDPRKGVEQLIEAFAAWAHERQRAETLVLAGRLGPAAQALGDLVKHTGAPVLFTGFVPDEELAVLYSGARALVTASRYEGFGLPALEALACGTPVAAYRVGALPEVAGPGALLCTDGDADGLIRSLERLCDEPALRDRLAAAGRAHAARFSWRRSAELTWAAYERALGATR